jgi:hypothetical protein
VGVAGGGVRAERPAVEVARGDAVGLVAVAVARGDDGDGAGGFGVCAGALAAAAFAVLSIDARAVSLDRPPLSGGVLLGVLVDWRWRVRSAPRGASGRPALRVWLVRPGLPVRRAGPVAAPERAEVAAVCD